MENLLFQNKIDFSSDNPSICHSERSEESSQSGCHSERSEESSPITTSGFFTPLRSVQNDIFKFLILIFIILNIENIPSFSQKPPCFPSYIQTTFVDNFVNYIPPLTLNMPYDIIQEYLYIYNINTTTYDKVSFLNFLNNQQGFTDTIRKLFRNIYILTDYDPLSFEWYIHSNFEFIYYYTYAPSHYFSDIDDAILNKSPHPFLDDVLFKSFYILELNISEQEIRDNGLMLKCIISDTIKGKIQPTCKDTRMPDSTEYYDTIPRREITLPGQCFEFCLGNSQKPIFLQYNHFIAYVLVGSICEDTSKNIVYYTTGEYVKDNITNY